MKNRVNTLGVFFLLILIAFAVGECKGQSNTRTRQIRFATGVQYASDTAETVDNAGRIWYDFNTGKYRCNIDGTNTDLVSGGMAYTAGSGLTLSGNEFINGGNFTTIQLLKLNTDPDNNYYEISYSTAVGDLMKTMINGDASQSVTSNPYEMFYYSDVFQLLYGVGMNQSSIKIGSATPFNGFDKAHIQIDDDLGTGTPVIRMLNIPTVNPCGTYGTGTIWNDTGTLKICP